MSKGQSESRKKRGYVSFEVIKGLHNLISWKLFNSNSRDLHTETLPNRKEARNIDKEIDAYKALHGLD
tara:strand:- start:19 stop:222 length:204 start_codon:yes stop_codon:yes gene_type:complete